MRFDRREFLQTASVVAGAACASRAFGMETAPAFTDKPAFDANTVVCTWRRDPTTTMMIQWIGSEADGADRPIWYSKAGSMEWKQAPQEARPFPMTKLKLYRTELTGLEPGTDYQFRVGLDSAEMKFRTMPAKATDTFQFVSGGDSGIGEPAQHTSQNAANQDPYFCLLGGDLAYENGILAAVFVQFVKNYAQTMIDSKGRKIPLVACIGNHEVRGGYHRPRTDAPFFYAFFDGLYPETGYASLDFGDYLSVVLLDSDHTTPIAGEQTSWLEKTLKEREEFPNVFIAYHVPSYPSVRNYIDGEGRDDTGGPSRKHWVPLFERHNVDAVLEHHDHAYKRTFPMFDGRVDQNGIVYLGDGSWGQLRKPAAPGARPYLAVTDEAYHLTLHRIEGDERFHVALSDKGKIVDVCTTTKRSRLLGAKASSPAG